MKVKNKKPVLSLLMVILAALLTPTMATQGDCDAALRSACSPDNSGGYGPSGANCQICTGHFQHQLREAGCTYGEMNASQLMRLGSRGKAARALAPDLRRLFHLN